MLARAWRHTNSSVPAISGWSARVAIRDCCCSERLLAMDRQIEAVIAAVSAPLMSASSVIGNTSAIWQAASIETPWAMSRPAWISMRVETPSSSPWPLRLRERCADRDQLVRHRDVDAGLVRNDFGLDGGGRIAEVHRAEALLGRFLEILENALVAGVVGDDELEVGMRAHELPASPAAARGGRRSADG